MAIALSTAWNAFRYQEGTGIIAEIKRLGFSEVELSFNLTEGIVEDIGELVARNKIKVCSVHNYCPIPAGLNRQEALPDCYSLASADEKERALAVKYTKITIDTAARISAEGVILHCGRVDITDLTRDLIALYNNNQLASRQANSLKEKMHKAREEKIEAHFPQVVKSLEELAPYASSRNIKLAIENRFYFREIPSFEETARLLAHFKGRGVYYWHDTGHAQLWENLGFIRHEEYLLNYSGNLLGFHLHDIDGTSDHKALLYKGTAEQTTPRRNGCSFDMLKPYLRTDCLMTIEAHYPATSQDLIKSKEYLEDLLKS